MQLQATELPPGAQATVVLWAQLVQAKKQSPFNSALSNAHVYCYALCYAYAMIINRYFSHLTVSICILRCF